MRWKRNPLKAKSVTLTVLVALLLIVSGGITTVSAESQTSEQPEVEEGPDGSVSATGEWILKDGWVINWEGSRVLPEEDLPHDLREEASGGNPVATTVSASASATADCGDYDGDSDEWWAYTKYEASASSDSSNILGSYEASGHGTLTGSDAQAAAWPLSHKASVFDSQTDWVDDGTTVEAVAFAEASSFIAPVPAQEDEDTDVCDSGNLDISLDPILDLIREIIG